ncbi:MAG: hypothetical protein C4313_10750 [Thermoflexus sp.]|uniref:Fur family transcriptional regulator n=1 Tax=Thermoflexus sp. TaxID=1969742 RepID=UPI003330F3EB
MPHCLHARRLLRQHGYRVTPQRLMVLEVLRTADRHLTAEEIHAALQARSPGVDLSTVYRALRLFSRLGLLDRHDIGGGRSVYELRVRPDHGHFICERCGRVEHLEAEPFEGVRQALERGGGYRILRLTATVVGICPACQAREEDGA